MRRPLKGIRRLSKGLRRVVLSVKRRSPRDSLGRWGERRALAYLKREGYRILDVRWKYSRFEVDIVAATDSVLCFVEVKTRIRMSSPDFDPLRAVNERKQDHISAAAEHYRLKYSRRLKRLRIRRSRYDIIAILVDDWHSLRPEFSLEHIKEAFH